MPSTDVRFEFQGALAQAVGPLNGLTSAEWAALGGETTAIVRRLNETPPETPYRNVSTDEKLTQVKKVLAVARRAKGEFDDVVVLGIGGSALGTIALRTALKPPYWNMLSAEGRKGLPRLWVMDNVDPAEFRAMTELIDPHRTLFIVISKSGETGETLSQFLVTMDLVRDCVGDDDWRRHFIIITEPAQPGKANVLREAATSLELESFEAFPKLGGRWSVLSPVGLLPAALIGIDVEGLLRGAGDMVKRCTREDFSTNPAAQGAAVQIGLYRKGKPMSVMMAYAAALKDVADWYRQLWAESLGKVCAGGTFVGPTPIKALGVTDQHSQVQLYRQGPADKVFTILSVEDYGDDVKFPALKDVPKGFDFLKGRTMKDLFRAEERATLWALAGVSQRPVTKIVVPQVTARNIGGLLMMLMVQTSLAGAMLGIDAYDQPGVEAGKHAAMALLGAAGAISNHLAKGLPADCKTYEILRRRIESSPV
jgi:glucose-6-phosphate isomerase